jgi:hypothetical protein
VALNSCILVVARTKPHLVDAFFAGSSSRLTPLRLPTSLKPMGAAASDLFDLTLRALSKGAEWPLRQLPASDRSVS